MRTPLALLALLAVACAPAPPVAQVSVAPPPPITASARPSTPPPQEPPPAPPEIVARLRPEQRETLTQLAALCQPAVAEKDGALLAGCIACSANSAPAADPRPRLVPAAELVEPLSFLRGAFTEMGADEHLVTMANCTCNGCPNDAYVLRRGADGAPQIHRRVELRTATSCKLVRRPDQVDRPLCLAQQARMGYAASILALYDFFDLREGDSREPVPLFSFTALDDLLLRCAPRASYLSRALVRWDLRAPEADLLVDLDVADGVVTPKILAACSASLEGQTPPPAAFPPSRRLHLVWKPAPRGFSPTGATAAHLRALAAAQKKAEVGN
jgi:hypothetical protein